MPYSSKATNNKSTWYRGHGHYSKQKVPEFLQPNFSGRSLFSSAPEKTFFFFQYKELYFFPSSAFQFLSIYFYTVHEERTMYTCLESQCLWSRSPSFLPVRRYTLLGDSADPLTYSRHRREQNSSPVCLHMTPLVWSACLWWGPKQTEDHAVWYFQLYQPIKHIKNTCYLCSVKLCIQNITCNL